MAIPYLPNHFCRVKLHYLRRLAVYLKIAGARRLSREALCERMEQVLWRTGDSGRIEEREES